MQEKVISVALDEVLVSKLLRGLYHGAKKKSLKVIISTAGEYHVKSRELRMCITTDEAGEKAKSISIHNDSLSAFVSQEDLEKYNLSDLANKMVYELREKYSTVFHSLADNIVVFSRAYRDN